MYAVVLRHRLATYTSCFRVYRRSAVRRLSVRDGGFLGVAELLGRLDLDGGRIVECPAVLEVRLLGRSKMKTVRTIFGHLLLLMRLTIDRIRMPATKPAENRSLGKSADAGEQHPARASESEVDPKNASVG